MERLDKLDMEGHFPPSLQEFEKHLADLLSHLDPERVEEHVSLAVEAPTGIFDSEHFEQPAVFSLLAYGLPGIHGLKRLALRLHQSDAGSYWAPRALMAASLPAPKVAQQSLWLAHRYPHLAPVRFERLKSAVRRTIKSRADREAAYDAFLEFLEGVQADPVRFGSLLATGSLLFNGAGRDVDDWMRKAIAQATRPLDAFGIMWDGRHLIRDLVRALRCASKGEPLSVVFADMNGLKHINDTAGHEFGDHAIKIYLHALRSSCESVGRCYRKGGDEVVILLPKTSATRALGLLRKALKRLGTTKLQAGDQPPTDPLDPNALQIRGMPFREPTSKDVSPDQ